MASIDSYNFRKLFNNSDKSNDLTIGKNIPSFLVFCFYIKNSNNNIAVQLYKIIYGVEAIINLFKEKEEIVISVICKFCESEIKIPISIKEYEETKEFPITKEIVHGEPAHKLIAFINKNLEIENFEIREAIKKQDGTYSKELTKQVLGEIGLSDDEIKLYFLTTGLDTVSLGELPLLINKTKEECQEIAEKFVEKGLYKRIVGTTPHYSPLPPYSALVFQLQNFHKYIKKIKMNTPNQLIDSFSQLEANLMSQMNSQKQEVNNILMNISQISEISKIIVNLEEDIKRIMDSQIEEFTNQFEEIKTIISQNLQKFHLGVIKQTVTQVIENVLTSRLDIITQNLNDQFISNMKDILKSTSANINEITTSSTKTEESIKSMFEGLFQSFSDLKNIFSTKVIDTLNEELTNILNKLEISEITTREFWEQAKRETIFTMNDIWFIRSIESAKAHIKEEISKAKMRLLIVVPNITDLDINSLKALRKHVNIRIATNIDVNSSKHLKILQELDILPNVSYRHYKFQNLWGINRDYEEVILSIISNVNVEGKIRTEIGGIGSIIAEHIKIFVPVLEEAWVRAQKKELLFEHKPYDLPKLIKKPLPTQNFQDTTTSPSKTQYISSKIFEDVKKVEPDIAQPGVTSQPAVEILIREEENQVIETSQISSFSDKKELDLLSKQYDEILNNLERLTGQEISLRLKDFVNDYTEKKNYHSVLGQINRRISILKNNPNILISAEIKPLNKTLKSWRNKLQI